MLFFSLNGISSSLEVSAATQFDNVPFLTIGSDKTYFGIYI